MTSSIQEANAETATTAPCLSVIGIGRTGAVYVEALLRTGEIEDLMVEKGATCAALVIDIGDDDMSLADDYGASFYKRLESRGIPADRFLYQSISLPVPSEKELDAPYLPKKTKVPKPGEHFPRAVAKAVYAANAGVVEDAISKFTAQVEKATVPALIAVAFSLAGGTGAGIAVDLARQLKLTKPIPVFGIGGLAHTGDPEPYKSGASLCATLNELDCLLDDTKNAAVVAKHGESYKNPFTGGFFVVNPEQSWQRLTAYTTTGEARIRQAIKEMVTNRFVADSFMRWCLANQSSDLGALLRKAGKADEIGFMLFDVAKLTHPGVQVLPGEAPSKWEAVIHQWTNYTPKYAGLKEGFKTKIAHVSLYGSRNMGYEVMIESFQEMMKTTYLEDQTTPLPISIYEFFDVLTAYGNVVLTGVGKTDLLAFVESQTAFDKLSADEKAKESSMLMEVGPMLVGADGVK